MAASELGPLHALPNEQDSAVFCPKPTFTLFYILGLDTYYIQITFEDPIACSV
jgi:hypothetical protein